MDNIYQYQPSQEHDLMLLIWLNAMCATGEVEKTFSSVQRTPSRFLDFFRFRPLFFQVDEFGNIKRACWFEPCMGSTFWGMYIAPGARHSEPFANITFADYMINEAFKSGIPTLVGLIQHRPTVNETAKFIDLHERAWGFEYCGSVPYFFEGKDCHIVALTSEGWNLWVEEKVAKHSSQKRWRALSSS